MPTSATSPLGADIRALREAKGLSVRRAATIAGVSEGRWRQVERGYQQITGDVHVPVHPSARFLRAMARALDADPVPWLHKAGYSAATAVEDEDAGSTDPVVAAIMADRTLLPDAKAHFLNQLRLLRRVSPLTDEEVRENYDAELMEDLAAQPDDEVSQKRNRRTCT